MTDDLNLSASYAERDARYYCNEHEALRFFVTKREGAPSIGEPVRDVGKPGQVLSLHVGPGRGATTWDEAEDVCWLLAYSPTHATHEERDVYKYLQHLDGRDELLPTADDYEALNELSEVSVLDGLTAASANMYELARANPGVEQNSSYGLRDALMVMDLVTEATASIEQGWLAVTFPRDTPLLVDAAADLLSRILPADLPIESIQQTSSYHGKPARWDQVVMTWSASH